MPHTDPKTEFLVDVYPEDDGYLDDPLMPAPPLTDEQLEAEAAYYLAPAPGCSCGTPEHACRCGAAAAAERQRGEWL